VAGCSTTSTNPLIEAWLEQLARATLVFVAFGLCSSSARPSARLRAQLQREHTTTPKNRPLQGLEIPMIEASPDVPRESIDRRPVHSVDEAAPAFHCDASRRVDPRRDWGRGLRPLEMPRAPFRGAPQLVGSRVQLNGREVTVFGVAPSDFRLAGWCRGVAASLSEVGAGSPGGHWRR